MKDKILYVSDLDGTLLRSDEKTSTYTNATINTLVEQGILFSYATARSFVTSSKVTAGLYAKFPVIVYNGAFVINNNSDDIIASNFFSRNDVDYISSQLVQQGINPIVYSLLDNKERFSYCSKKVNTQTAGFLNSRKGDVRDNPVDSLQELLWGDIFYFTCIDATEKLKPVYELLKETFNCVFHRDIYSGEQWLEIMPLNATKACTILQLKELLGCNKVISFGDGKNDISMFQISDECYAVENAVDELKVIATGIIGNNDNDSVAKWLAENAIV